MDPTVPLAHKSNITVSAAKLVPPDNHVRDACRLVQVVRVCPRGSDCFCSYPRLTLTRPLHVQLRLARQILKKRPLLNHCLAQILGGGTYSARPN